MNLLRDANVALKVKFFSYTVGVILEVTGWCIILYTNWKIGVGLFLLLWAKGLIKTSK